MQDGSLFRQIVRCMHVRMMFSLLDVVFKLQEVGIWEKGQTKRAQICITPLGSVLHGSPASTLTSLVDWYPSEGSTIQTAVQDS